MEVKGFNNFFSSKYETGLDWIDKAIEKAGYEFVYMPNHEAAEQFPFTMEELKEASRQGLIDKKVYALGGMNLDTIREIKDLGFGGIVICGDIWNRFNIHQELDYQEVINHFSKLRKAIS